jgi:hypothetical protein
MMKKSFRPLGIAQDLPEPDSDEDLRYLLAFCILTLNSRKKIKRHCNFP